MCFSCNTNQKNSLGWTDNDKDFVFEECIRYALVAEAMSKESANEYCYCSLDIIIEQSNEMKIDNEADKFLTLILGLIKGIKTARPINKNIILRSRLPNIVIYLFINLPI